ncbi:MAG: alpha/beta hydrolase [Atribacterota bacterium]
MRIERWFTFFCLLVFSLMVIQEGRAQEQVSPFENGRFWRSDSGSLHYQIWFPPLPRGKVLLIHGLGGSTFSWRFAPSFLTQAGYVVVAIDLPGFGYSERVVGKVHESENRARLLLDFLHALDREVIPKSVANEKWHLVGHSMGGSTAFLMAMETPERFYSAVLIDAALGARSFHLLKIFTSFPLTKQCWITFIRNVFLSRSNIRRSLSSAYGRKPTAEEVEGYFRPLQRKGTARSLLSLTNQASFLRLSPFRGKPHPPFLLIWGEKDRVIPSKQAKRFQKFFPETPLYIIKGASHCPMETHPEEVYSLMVQFFSTQ